jgi:hypothetical protein
VHVCVTESVGGPQWAGNRSMVEKAMVAAGGNPRTYRGPDTEPCKITLRRWCAAYAAAAAAYALRLFFLLACLLACARANSCDVVRVPARSR